MPEYSRIRTFLTQRKDNGSLLPEKRFDVQARDVERIMIPAIAYQVCLTSSSVPDNIVTRTIIDLAKYYEAKGVEFGLALDAIAERTKLERTLVKAVIKRYRNTLDVERDEENEALTQEFYYALYDPIMKRCLPELIPQEDYEKNTFFGETEYYVDLQRGKSPFFYFTLSMSDSRSYKCHVLKYDLEDKDIPKDPKSFYSAGIKNQYLRRPKSKLEYTGLSESVGLICPCFLSKLDLSKLHIIGPTGKGPMDQLMESIQKGLESFPERNEELSVCVREMDRKRRALLDELVTSINAKEEIKKQQKRVLSCFPGIKQYSEVWEKTAELWAVIESSRKASEDTAAPVSLQEINGRDLVLAFYTLLEKIFAVSVVKNYPHDKVKQMEQLTSHLKSSRDNAHYFAGIAEQIGLEDTQKTVEFFQRKDSRVRRGKLEAILRASFTGGAFPESLPELVAAHFIQAAVFDEHPFRKVIRQCPGLLQTVRRFLPERNDMKHGNKDTVILTETRDITEMCVLAEAMIDTLLVPRVSFVEQERNEADIDHRPNAWIKAEEELKKYSGLSNEQEEKLHKSAKYVCFRFHYQDPEYISECSNLLSVLLDLLLREFTVQSQRRAAAERFTGDRFTDDARMHQLFDAYSCDYPSNDKPNTAKLRSQIDDPSRMTLKCKLYLAFVVLDEEKPDFLKSLLRQVPGLPKLIDEVCVARGHNSSTDFSTLSDTFHTELLEICDAFFNAMKGGT